MDGAKVVGRQLAVPAAAASHFRVNLLLQAVCELRFPTLYDLRQDVPPIQLAKVLRKEYPIHETSNDLNVGAGGIAHAFAHVFRGKRWSVTLRANSITIETNKYTSYADFRERILQILAIAPETIDADFFTRVGLRYINVVPYAQAEVAKWVNPSLVESLATGVYGDPAEHWNKIAGTTDIGTYTFQHGISNGPPSQRRYVLDLDFSAEDVKTEDCIITIDKLHEMEFSMFIWALGDSAKALLEKNRDK